MYYCVKGLIETIGNAVIRSIEEMEHSISSGKEARSLLLKSIGE
jgi:hypothetical protein